MSLKPYFLPQNLKMEKPSAILLDIEGTTTDPTFVSRKLIPVIESNVPNYFRETYSRSETKELIKRIREARAAATEEEQRMNYLDNLQNFLTCLSN